MVPNHAKSLIYRDTNRLEKEKARKGRQREIIKNFRTGSITVLLFTRKDKFPEVTLTKFIVNSVTEEWTTSINCY